jgi:hypothetical protein
MKWLVAAVCAAVAVFLVFGPLLDALDVEVPDAVYLFAVALLPASIGIAILRYRLYDIDYLINRTLVYAAVTGVLAGVYSACVSLFGLLSQEFVGESSNAEIVLTALVLTAVFTPVKDALKALADRYIGGDRQSQLEAYSERLRGLIEVLDPTENCRQVAERAVRDLNATGAAIYMDAAGMLFCVAVSGQYDERRARRIPITYMDEPMGFISLSRPLDGAAFTEKQLASLQTAADLLGHVLALSRRTSQPAHVADAYPDLVPASHVHQPG